MLHRKLAVLILLTCAVGLSLAGCGPTGNPAPSGATPAAPQPTTAVAAQPAATTGGKPVRGGQLVAAMDRDATTFDPTRSQDVFSNAVIGLVCDSLYKIDDKAQVVGSLVEKTANPQPNVYVLTLRKGLKFQDGTAVDAEAVKFNLQRHINDPKSVRNQDVKDITSIDTPDPLTVTVTLKGPFAPFTSKLAGGAGYILSPTAIARLGDNLPRDLTGAGSGPYKFVSWQPDNQIVLDRNPDYWVKDADGTQLPYLDRITLKPFPDENVRLTNVKTGDADVLLGPPPYKDVEDLKKSTDLTVKEIPGLGFQFITVNTQKDPFTNPAVRRALAYAIDRDQIRQAVYFGLGKTLQLPVPAVLPWAFVKDNLPYTTRDVNKARQELQSAGQSDVSFALQISNNSPQLQQIAELIKDQIKDAGITMDISLIDFATVIQHGNSGEYQALSLGWSGDVDPDGDLYSLLYTRAGFNFARYSNPEFDKLLDAGRANLDQAKRGQAYLDAQQILVQDQPMVVLYNTPQISVTRKDIQNYPQTYDGYWGVRDLEKVWRSK